MHVELIFKLGRFSSNIVHDAAINNTEKRVFNLKKTKRALHYRQVKLFSLLLVLITLVQFVCRFHRATLARCSRDSSQGLPCRQLRGN